MLSILQPAVAKLDLPGDYASEGTVDALFIIAAQPVSQLLDSPIKFICATSRCAIAVLSQHSPFSSTGCSRQCLQEVLN